MHKNRCGYYHVIRHGGKITDFPIIDHHGHLYRSASLLDQLTEIREVFDATGIARGVVFSTIPPYRDANDLVVEGVKQAGGWLSGYATLVNDPPAAMVDELKRCRDLGLRGLKLHSSFCSGFDAPEWREVWRFCAASGWPVIIHGMIPELARENPETVFIHAHGIESIFFQSPRQVMRDCPNYYWDTSSSLIRMGAIEKAVEWFGSERLLFGSDFPLNNPATRLGAVLTARISDQDMRNILGGNISRLLNL